MRARLLILVEHPAFQRFILAVIVVNAIGLGLETWPAAMASAGGLIVALDRLALAIFIVEVALRLIAHGGRFFRDPWSVFDFSVVAIALVPAAEGFAVLRTLRVLRALRLISAVPRMRLVVEALLSAIPGISSIFALLLLIFYVAAVMATKLFGELGPEWFGSIGRSFFTLFQIMTLEGWADIARTLMATAPWAWAFFVPFILVVTFTVLNLFIAVVVSAMQSSHDAELARENQAAHDERGQILAEIRQLRHEIQALRDKGTGP
jgi:voltage-gated sodium channel